jgi:hypothetical protein
MSMELLAQRMRRIGNKRNFNLESQSEELKKNESLIVYHKRTDGGITLIDLILEPDKFDEFSSAYRLTYDEYIDVINDFIEEEEKTWHELRMRDQVNETRDRIIEATIIKYAEEHLGIKKEDFNGKDINYLKRYDENGKYLGEAVIVTLTMIPEMNINIQ